MVVIVDYNMGNVGSVKNAVEAIGHEAVISRSAIDFTAASHIILPGVGSFGEGMKNLRDLGLVEILKEQVMSAKKPFLGLCLGMQLLAGTGEEGGEQAGLGFIAGHTRKFQIDEKQYKIPHVGWNDVVPRGNAKLFQGIKKPIFYFVHSYHFVPEAESALAGETEYGEKFAAAVEQGNVFGVQFHPEKSGAAGLRILENFLATTNLRIPTNT